MTSSDGNVLPLHCVTCLFSGTFAMKCILWIFPFSLLLCKLQPTPAHLLKLVHTSKASSFILHIIYSFLLINHLYYTLADREQHC